MGIFSIHKSKEGNDLVFILLQEKQIVNFSPLHNWGFKMIAWCFPLDLQCIKHSILISDKKFQNKIDSGYRNQIIGKPDGMCKICVWK